MLYIAKSIIPASGIGLYTAEFISKNTCFAEYYGTVYKAEKTQTRPYTMYAFEINENHVIDADESCMARYANDAEGAIQIMGLHNNTYFRIKEEQVFLCSLYDIPAHSEILVSYGTDFWNMFDVNVMKEKASKKAEQIYRKRKITS